MDNNIAVDLTDILYSGMDCFIFFTIRFTEGLCDGQKELFGAVGHGDPLSIEELSAAGKRLCSLA
jgi:hypothetical protein